MRKLAVALVLAVLPVIAAGSSAQLRAAQGLQVPPADQGKLRADRVRYQAKEQIFIAEGNVRLSLGSVEIRARRLRLEQRSQLAYASGDVHVAQGDIALQAAEVKYEIRSKVAHASGSVVLAQEDSIVRAGQMKFELASQLTFASGGVVVTQKDVTVTASHLKHNGKTQDIFAEASVTLQQGGSVLTAQTLQANLGTKRAEVKGNARLVRAPGGTSSGDQVVSALVREETTITAPHMAFRWDINEAVADGGVVVSQRDKTARARSALYSEVAGRIELVDEVVVEQLSGDWLVRGGVMETPKDEKIKQALASKTTITCERLVILLKTKDMRAERKVTVTQRGRSATGDRAAYSDKERRLVVTGNVLLLDEDGSRLRADQVVISLADETFEAVGNVETEFTVKRGK